MAARKHKPIEGLGINAKEFAFAKLILSGMGHIEAARESGFYKGKSDNGAAVAAQRLLNSVNVQEFMQKELQLQADKRRKEIEVDDLWVTKNFKDVFERCMQRKPVMEYNREEQRLEQARDEEGNHIWTFDSTGANRSLENIAKHIGYYEKDNAQKQPIIKVGIIQNVENYFFDESSEQGEITNGEITNE